MSRRVLLAPNFGAEEDRLLSGVAPALSSALASTWATLFSEPLEVLGGATAELPWRKSKAAAFPFLHDVAGLVPWLSTRDMEERARALGLPVWGPPPAAAAIVGDKGWALEVAQQSGLVPDALAVCLTAFSPEELTAPDARARIDGRLSSWPAWARTHFVLKPRRGSSGRGRVPGRDGRLDDAGARALPRLARRGGALLEPWLDRSEDLSAQLFVDEQGRVSVVGLTRQLASRSGVWAGNAVHLDEGGRVSSGSPFDDELLQAALVIGERARLEGFRGPLGVDAFAYRIQGGPAVLRPVVEVNARFTMGMITVGLARRALEAGLVAPEQRCCWRPHVAEASPTTSVRSLPLPAGALFLADDDAALAPYLETGGNPKRR